MTGETLLRAIGNISDELIEAAEEPVQIRHAARWARWGALAASLVIVAGISVLIPKLNAQNTSDMAQTTESVPVETETSGAETQTTESAEAESAMEESATVPEAPTEDSAAQIENAYQSDAVEAAEGEKRVTELHINTAGSYSPKPLGDTEELLTFENTRDSFEVFGGQCVPDTLTNGETLIDGETAVTRYAADSGEYAYRAEYAYSGGITVTVESTGESYIFDGKFDPDFTGLESKWLSAIESLGGNYFIARTADRTYLQLINVSPKSLTEQDGELWVVGDEKDAEHLLLTVSCDALATESELIALAESFHVQFYVQR